MSSIMITADSAAIEGRHTRTAAQPAPAAKAGVSLLRRLEGIAAGVLFLAIRAPLYVGLLLFGALVSLSGVVFYLIQAIGLRLTRPAGAAATAVLALVSIAGPRQAKADPIGETSLLHQTTPVSSQQTNLYSFEAPGAGTLSVTLKDWGFPVPLQQLSASILFQDQSWSLAPAPGQSSEWLLDLPISTGGLFDAFVAAEAGTMPGTTYQFGAYSLKIDFEPEATPVPLPPALDLLLGGMGLLGAVSLVERISRRRNRDVISIA